jgi:hypothetical protein
MRTLTAFVAGVLATASPLASAGQFIDLAVVDRTTGLRIPVHRHDGKLYVAGKVGDRYAVRIANRSAGRVLAVVSVDGVNVVTGEIASPEQNGYVLASGQAFDIMGWRKSLNEVAAFYFTQLPNSYAARTDRPNHVGVIGVAVFREWSAPRSAITPYASPRSRRAESHGADSATASSAPTEDGVAVLERRKHMSEEKIGTGHGEREHSEVVYTDFRRATAGPSETITLYYDTQANLIARGIVRPSVPVVAPNPFPAGRFVSDPRT